MTSSNRNLLVLFKKGSLHDQAKEKELEWINEMLLSSITPFQFCNASELVDRNRITSSYKKILKETRLTRLKAFRFLINKN
ncbi:MAG: hypothetical protein ABIT05_12510 [Chitinophagaceae bacterium]